MRPGEPLPSSACGRPTGCWGERFGAGEATGAPAEPLRSSSGCAPGAGLGRPAAGPRWAALLLLVTAAVPARAATTLTARQGVQLALRNSPLLREAQAGLDAAKARVDGAGLLLRHNPELSAGVGSRPSGSGPTVEYEFSLSQPLEIAGQRGARVDAAESAVRAAAARLEAQRAEVAASVREAFGHALAARARLKLAEEAVTLASQAVSAAELRHRAGAASAIEVNTAKVELGRARTARLAASHQTSEADAALRLRAGIPASDELALVGALEPATAPEALDAGQLAAAARRGRPELVAARHDVEAAQAEQKLAGREAVPTPRLGARLERGDQAATVLMGTLSIELPFFNRNQAARGESSARLRAAEAALEGLERRVEEEVRLAVGRLRSAREAAEAFRAEALPALDENTRLVTRGYEAGELDFLQLLVIRRELLAARAEYLSTLEELDAAAANLDRVTGTVPP